MSRPDKQMRMRLQKEGYPEPDIYINEWGKERAYCPVCAKDTLINGYIRHYYLVHTPEGFADIQRMLAKRRG